MASATAPKPRRWSDFMTCTRILNVMVILGFMFNYMLRVNLTIAIIAMINKNGTSSSVNSTASINSTEHASNGTSSSGFATFDWTETQKNDILGSFFWGYLLTELPGGRLSEMVGPRRVFGGGMLLASLLTVLTPAACHASYYAVLVLRALLGLFLGATWPAILPMAAHWVPPTERSKFIANMMASSLGAAITMPVCGVLIGWDASGWPGVFYVTGGIGLAWSAAWFYLVYDSPARHPRIGREEREDVERRVREGVRVGKRPSSVPWGGMLTSGPVWGIVLTHGCSVFCYFTVVNQLPSYMDQVLRFNIKKNGFLSSLPYLGKYAMAVLASYFADRILRSGKYSRTATRKAFTTFAVLTPALFMTVEAIWGEDAVLSVVVFTASLFFNGAVTAGYMSNGLDIAPNFSGTIFGMANTLSSFGGWLSTKIVALLTEKEQTFERWRWMFWILVGAYVFGAVNYLVLGTGELQSWNFVEEEVRDEKEMKPLKEKGDVEEA